MAAHRLHQRSCDGILVSGDGTDDADLRTLCLFQLRQQQLYEKKVRQVVHTHGHFKALVCKAGLWVSGQVDGGVADEAVQPPAAGQNLLE
eukprot:scaffold25983_cov56-Isochrysis_galbana.AAC.1